MVWIVFWCKEVLGQLQVTTIAHEFCTISVRPWISVVAFDKATILNVSIVFDGYIAQDWCCTFIQHVFESRQTIEDSICIFTDDRDAISFDRQGIGINLIKESLRQIWHFFFGLGILPMHTKVDVRCTCHCCWTTCVRDLMILQDTLQAVARIDIQLIAHDKIDLLMKLGHAFTISNFLWGWKDLVFFLEIVLTLGSSSNRFITCWLLSYKTISEFGCTITHFLNFRLFWSFRFFWASRLFWFATRKWLEQMDFSSTAKSCNTC